MPPGDRRILAAHPNVPDSELSPLPYTRLRWPAEIEVGSVFLDGCAGVMTLKGKMFERLASGLCNAPEVWGRLVSDNSSATVLSLIEAGLGHK
jgi:hypothetical protein